MCVWWPSGSCHLKLSSDMARTKGDECSRLFFSCLSDRPFDRRCHRLPSSAGTPPSPLRYPFALPSSGTPVPRHRSSRLLGRKHRPRQSPHSALMCRVSRGPRTLVGSTSLKHCPGRTEVCAGSGPCAEHGLNTCAGRDDDLGPIMGEERDGEYSGRARDGSWPGLVWSGFR